MGIRFYDSEDMLSDDDYTTSCYSCSCQTSSTCQKSSKTSATPKTSNNSYNGNYLNAEKPTLPKSGVYKDIVGNCKEVRIEENSHNLRIIGNNNRIRITLNMGDLIVIGNNTRLKVKTNQGHIKYTGNDGRISLGNESKQQLVEYIGCNGILKVVNSLNINKQHEKCINKNSPKTSAEKKVIHKQFIGNNTKTNCKNNNENKPKEKSHSFGGASDDYNKWQKFNNLFNNIKSMPNLTTPNYSQNYSNQPLPINIIQNIGDIVIANSSNICITPYTRNILTQA